MPSHARRWLVSKPKLVSVLRIAALGWACSACGCGSSAAIQSAADSPRLRAPSAGASAGAPSGSATGPRAPSAQGAPLDVQPERVYGHPLLDRPDSSRAVAYSTDETVLAIGAESGLIRLVDALTGAPLGALHSHRSRVSLLVRAPDGRLLSGDRNGELVLWAPGAHGWLDARPRVLPSRHRAALSDASVGPFAA